MSGTKLTIGRRRFLQILGMGAAAVGSAAIGVAVASDFAGVASAVAAERSAAGVDLEADDSVFPAEALPTPFSSSFLITRSLISAAELP